jgi:hypothetical protein
VDTEPNTSRLLPFMKTKTALQWWLIVAASLMAAANVVSAASQAIYTDSWKDAGTNESASTIGSFSIGFSVPVDGVDLSEIDSNSQFFLYINSVEIASNTLGNAANYAAGNTSATFPITEQDSAGNEITNGSVTVNWTAATITVSGSATNDLLDEGANFAYNGQIFSPKSTRFSFEYYEVSLTLDASDNGGGTFNYDNPYVQVIGHNSGTDHKLPDDSGTNYFETGSERGVISVPELTINSPALDSKVYDADPVVNLIGTANDDVGLSSIQCYVNGDTTNPISIDQSYDLPTNEIAWTAEVDLSQFGQVGSNVISVIAQDLGGNQTTMSRTFLWIETNAAVVTVNPPGAGIVKGVKNGQVLQVNNGYAVTATSTNKNLIFWEWTDGSGDVLSSNASFEYFDEIGTLTNSAFPTLIANFVPSPFTNADLVGTYTGLFYDTSNGVAVSDAGYITVTVTEAGNFSGKLYLATTTSPFALSGQLAAAADGSNATAELRFKVSKSEYLEVKLLVATDPVLTNAGAATLGGFVNAFSDQTETNLIDSAVIQGELSRDNTNIVPGIYNMALSPVSGDPATGPGGYSYGSATVDKKGAVAIVLHLADGTSPAMTFSSSLAQDGTSPFYTSLYGGKGVILGWVQFPLAGISFQETVNWVKLPLADKYYTNGFASAPTISVALYIPPKVETNNHLYLGEYFIVDESYSGLSLPNETDTFVAFDLAKNTFSIATNTNKVTITLTPATGLLTGSFVDPAGSKASFTYHGLFLLNEFGLGFYVSTNKETGPIFLGIPLPPPPVVESGGTTIHNLPTPGPPEPPPMQTIPVAGPLPPPL